MDLAGNSHFEWTRNGGAGQGRRFTTIRKPLKTATEKLGLPHVTHHGLRHAYATILLDEGVSLEKISKLLGHTTTRVTEQIYVHWQARHLRDAAESIQVGRTSP